LYYVNGPAVSRDQYVMRTILIVVAVVGAIGLRAWNWRKLRKRTVAEVPEDVQPPQAMEDSPENVPK
jgi:hypothetical protein